MTHILCSLSFSLFFLYMSFTPHSVSAQGLEGIEIPDGPVCFPCNDEDNPCDDGNTCTDDKCIDLPEEQGGGTGCEYTPNNELCDDGNSCTEDEFCKGGLCQGGSTVECGEDNDNNPCTALVCQPGFGCVPAAVSGPCDDGDPCTTGDNCTGGVCRGSPKVCDDGDRCTTNVCDPETGQCEYALDRDAECSKSKQCGGGLTCDFATCKCQQSCDANQPLPPGRQCKPDCKPGQACDSDCSCKDCPGDNNECTLACPGGECVIENNVCKCKRDCSKGPKQPGELCRNDCPQGQQCNEETCTCEQPCSANAGAPPDGVQCKNDCPAGLECNPAQCKCERPCSKGPKQPGEICKDDCKELGDDLFCDDQTCTCVQPCKANLGAKIPGAQCQPNCEPGKACNPLNCSCIECPNAKGECTLKCPLNSKCVFKGGKCACERRCSLGPMQDGEICRDDCPNKNLGVTCDQNTCTCQQPCAANIPGAPPAGVQCQPNCPQDQGQACNAKCNCVQCPDVAGGCPPGFCPPGTNCKVVDGQCSCERPCSKGPILEGEICGPDDCPNKDKGEFCDRNTCTCQQPCSEKLGPPQVGVCRKDCQPGEACDGNCNCVKCPIGDAPNQQCTLACPGGVCVIKDGKCFCERLCNQGPKQPGELCRPACPAGVICDEETCTCQVPCEQTAPLCNGNCPKDNDGNPQACVVRPNGACACGPPTCDQAVPQAGQCAPGCPNNQVCRPTADGRGCQCVNVCPEGQLAGQNQCGGECLNANQKCETVGNKCQCVTPCERAAQPLCGGICPDVQGQPQACKPLPGGACACGPPDCADQVPAAGKCQPGCPQGQVCEPDANGQKCKCVQACPEGQPAGQNQCGGRCPNANQECATVGNKCQCVTPCPASAPLCGGFCPNDPQNRPQACKPQAGGACACVPPDCDAQILAQQGGQCRPGCPKGKVCQLTADKAKCECVDACPEGEVGKACGGVCPNANQKCETVGNQCQCVVPCPASAPQCGGFCPNDPQNRPQACKPQPGGGCACGIPDCDKQDLKLQGGQCLPGCPKGQVCQLTADKRSCKCVDACPEGELNAKCGGVCPNPNQKCETVGNKCQCVIPCLASAPLCGGFCPNDVQNRPQACKPQAGGVCACVPPDCDAQILAQQGGQCRPGCPAGKVCQLTADKSKCECVDACPEGQPNLRCGGVCPDPKKECATVGNKCQCVVPCAASAPLCGGFCPNDAQNQPQACKQGAGGGCACGPPDCAQQLPQGGQCRPGCPNGQVCQPTADGRKCECVAACPEGQPGVQCRGVCPKPKECVTDGAACQCRTPVSCVKGNKPGQGEFCKPDCPQDQKNKICHPDQCKCVECIRNADCPDKVCQKKECINNACKYTNIGNCGPDRPCAAGQQCQNCECIAPGPGPGQPGFPFAPRAGGPFVGPQIGGAPVGGAPIGGAPAVPPPIGAAGAVGAAAAGPLAALPPIIAAAGGCPKWGDPKAPNEYKLLNEKKPDDPWVRDVNGNRIPTGKLCQYAGVDKCLTFCPGTPPVDPVVGCGHGSACPKKLCKDKCNPANGEEELRHVPCPDSNMVCCATAAQVRDRRLDRYVNLNEAREGVGGCKADFCKDNCERGEAHARNLTCRDRAKKCCAKLVNMEVCNPDLCKDKCGGDQTEIATVRCADPAKKCCMDDDAARAFERDSGCSKCFRRKIAEILNLCFAVEYEKDAGGNLILDPETDQPIPKTKRWNDGSPMKAEEGDDCYVEETKCELIAKRNERKQLIDKDGQPINLNDPDIDKKKVYECKQKRGVGKCGRETRAHMVTLPLNCQFVVCKGPDIGYKDCPQNKACSCGNGVLDEDPVMNPDKPEMVLYKGEQCDHGKLVNRDPTVDCPAGDVCDNECQCHPANCPVGGVIVQPVRAAGEEEKEAWQEKLAEWLGEKSVWAAEESDIPENQLFYAERDLCDEKRQFVKRILITKERVTKDQEEVYHVYTGTPGRMDRVQNIASMKYETSVDKRIVDSGINIFLQENQSGPPLIRISNTAGIWYADEPLNEAGECIGSPPAPPTTQSFAPAAPGAPGTTPGMPGTPGTSGTSGTPGTTSQPPTGTAPTGQPPPGDYSSGIPPIPTDQSLVAGIECEPPPTICNENLILPIYNGQAVKRNPDGTVKLGPDGKPELAELNRWFSVEVNGFPLSKQAGNAKRDGTDITEDSIEDAMIGPESTLSVTINAQSLCQQTPDGKPYIDYKVKCVRVCGNDMNDIFICKECKEVCSGRIPCCLCGNGFVNDSLNEQCDSGSPGYPPDKSVEEQCAERDSDCKGRDCTCNNNCQCVPPSKCGITVKGCGGEEIPQLGESDIHFTDTGEITRTYDTSTLCSQMRPEDVEQCCSKKDPNTGNKVSTYNMFVEAKCQPENMCIEHPVPVECPCPCQYEIEAIGTCIEGMTSGTVVPDELVKASVSIIDGDRYQCPDEKVKFEVDVIQQLGDMRVDLPPGYNPEDWPVARGDVRSADISFPVELHGTGEGLRAIGGCFIAKATIGERRPPIHAFATVVYVDTRPSGAGVRKPTFTIGGAVQKTETLEGCPFICKYERFCRQGDLRARIMTATINVPSRLAEIDFIQGEGQTISFTTAAGQICQYRCPHSADVASRLRGAGGTARVSVPLENVTDIVEGLESSPCPQAEATFDCGQGPADEIFNCPQYPPDRTVPPKRSEQVA